MIDRVLQGVDLFKSTAVIGGSIVAWYVMFMVEPIEIELKRVAKKVEAIDSGREQCMRRMDRVERDVELVRHTDDNYADEIKRLHNWRQDHQLQHAREGRQ